VFNNIKTPTPILFTTNALDPITPSAAITSSYFPGSAVLTANATGHCMAESECGTMYIRRYLENGTLPKSGTLCKVEQGPFMNGKEAKRSDSWLDGIEGDLFVYL
jgi:hypothetical protein